jgi:hypothetical protein
MSESCRTYMEMRSVYTILVGKPQGKRPRDRHRNKRQDITIKFRELECKGVNWTQLAQNSVQ